MGHLLTDGSGSVPYHGKSDSEDGAGGYVLASRRQVWLQ